MAQSSNTGEEVSDDILKPVKDLRDKAKNWLSGSKPAPKAPDNNRVDPKDVEAATASFAKKTEPAPAKTKPGQRIMAGKKVPTK